MHRGKRLKPPKEWRVPVIILVGAIVGLGFYILKASRATSYLSDNSTVCINCHVMTPQYITWKHSSHGEVANCNDCHVPQDNVFRKYFFKARDGMYHATMYTTYQVPEVIKMHEAGQQVVQENCIRCHENQITDVKHSDWVPGHAAHRTDRQCWECHREIPHGRVKSLSSVGYQLEPVEDRIEKESIIPDWIRENLNKTTTE